MTGMIAGAPCQDWSSQGARRATHHERISLFDPTLPEPKADESAPQQTAEARSTGGTGDENVADWQWTIFATSDSRMLLLVGVWITKTFDPKWANTDT